MGTGVLINIISCFPYRYRVRMIDARCSCFPPGKEHPTTSPPEDEPGPQLLRRHAWSEGEQIEDLENMEQVLTDRDALANAFTWGTTTQRYGSRALHCVVKSHNAEYSTCGLILSLWTLPMQGI